MIYFCDSSIVSTARGRATANQIFDCFSPPLFLVGWKKSVCRGGIIVSVLPKKAAILTCFIMAQSSNDSTKKSTAPLSAHLLAGSKLRKQLSGTLQEHVSAPTSDFAVKQLEKMGWKEGTGLGKKRDGIVSHIKVKRREESAGLGTEKHALETQQASEDWWKSSLGDTLAKLGGKNKKKSKKRQRHFTDEELFEATGGARFGTKGGKTRTKAKWRRTESDMTSSTAGEMTATSQTTNSSSTKVSSASSSETELEDIQEESEKAVVDGSSEESKSKQSKKKSKKSKRKGGDEKKSKKKKKSRKEEK